MLDLQGNFGLAEILVSLTLRERILPWSLPFDFGNLGILFRCRLRPNTIYHQITIRLSLVNIVEARKRSMFPSLHIQWITYEIPSFSYTLDSAIVCMAYDMAVLLTPKLIHAVDLTMFKPLPV